LYIIESPVYSRLDVNPGQLVQLRCNTSQIRNITWTKDNNDDDGYVDYICLNGHIDSDWHWLFTRSTENAHILAIADAKQKDSGVYNCYDGTGIRKVGYQLNVAGRRCICVYCVCENIAIGLYQ